MIKPKSQGYGKKIIKYLVLNIYLVLSNSLVHAQQYTIQHEFDGGVYVVDAKSIDNTIVFHCLAYLNSFTHNNASVNFNSCLYNRNDLNVLYIANGNSRKVVKGGLAYDLDRNSIFTASLLRFDTTIFCQDIFVKKGKKFGQELVLTAYDFLGQKTNQHIYKNKSKSGLAINDLDVAENISISGSIVLDTVWFDEFYFPPFNFGSEEGYILNIDKNTLIPKSGTKLTGRNDDRIIYNENNNNILFRTIESNSQEACILDKCGQTDLSTSRQSASTGLHFQNISKGIDTVYFHSHSSGYSTILAQESETGLFCAGSFTSSSIKVFGQRLFFDGSRSAYIARINKVFDEPVVKRLSSSEHLKIQDVDAVGNKTIIAGRYTGNLLLEKDIIRTSKGTEVNSFVLILDENNLQLQKVYNIHSTSGSARVIQILEIQERKLLQIYLEKTDSFYIEDKPISKNTIGDNGTLLLSLSDFITTSSNILDSETNNGIIVFPNPSSNKIVINSDFSDEEIAVRIININGKSFVPSFDRIKDVLHINVSNMIPGIYYIELIQEGIVKGIKVIVK